MPRKPAKHVPPTTTPTTTPATTLPHHLPPQATPSPESLTSPSPLTSSPSSPSPDFATRPTTPPLLHAWVRAHLGLDLPTTPLLAGHAAPFDYISRAFFADHDPDLASHLPPQATTTPDQHTSTPPHSLPLNLPILAPHTTTLTTQRDTVLLANRGGGKTFLGALATTLDLIFKPGIEIRVLGGSREQSRRMFAHLKRFFSPRHHPLLAELVDGKLSQGSLKLINGSTAEILAQSHTSVRGTRVQKLRCDEVELFRPDVWEAAQFVTRSKQCGDLFIHGTIECLSTMHLPYGVMHDLLRECAANRRTLLTWGVLDVLESCPPSRLCHPPAAQHQSNNISQHQTADSAHHHNITLPPPSAPCPLWDECQGRAKHTPFPGGHIIIDDAISQKRRVSIAAWNTEMLCLAPSRKNAVLPEFEPDLHVRSFSVVANILTTHPRDSHALLPPSVRHLPPEQLAAQFADHYIERSIPVERMLIGMDFGLRGPTVILWAAQDAQGTLWIVDELVESDKVVEDHARTILDGNATNRRAKALPPWPLPQVVSVDPAGAARSAVSAQSPISILKDLQLPIVALRQRVSIGLALLASRLRPASGQPRLWIHPSCHRLAASLAKYHYKSNDVDNLTPEKDGSDHAVDALRYLVTAADNAQGFQQANWASPSTPNQET